MNGISTPKLLVVFFLLCCQYSFAQYILNGSAQKISCNCYTLTEEKNTQSGSVWNSNKINLNNSFDFWFNVFLGCKDGDGADGIVFILQPISTSMGTSGGGMGFEGIQPSIGIALDTWQNSNYNDPVYDHISIQANGIVSHTNDLAGPVPASATSDNIEDCKWHRLRISWDAATKWLRAYFDGVLRVEKQINLIGTIFNNDPNVYWGFTGATGGAVNLQQFCTALNPMFTTPSGNNACEGSQVQFTDVSESFAPIVNYNWSFGDGTTSTLINPTHTYAAPGMYPVNLKIKGQDGCEKDSTATLTVGSVPNASLRVSDTCFGYTPSVFFQDKNVAVNYTWTIDGSQVPGNQPPVLNGLNSGAHQLKVVVSSLLTCGPPADRKADFTIKPLPQIEAQVKDGCINEMLSFKGSQTDNSTTIASWSWDLDDGYKAATQNALQSYHSTGQKRIRFWAEATNGCTSDTTFSSIVINAASAFAGNDTAVIKDTPFQLNGSGNGTFSWLPTIGLSNPFIPNPVAVLSDNQQYVVTVTTPEGCIAMDTVLIKTYKGPAVYVPSAFTPNGDGKNDLLKPVYVGIKELKQFAVFNRWGQMVFTTNDVSRGWEGKDAPNGTYVWFIKVTFNNDQTQVLKGTVTVIK